MALHRGYVVFGRRSWEKEVAERVGSPCLTVHRSGISRRGNVTTTAYANRSLAGVTAPCITLHQPWASLLVNGIKRIEGRDWPAPIQGRLWVHAAGRPPDRQLLEALQRFYKYAYSLDGVPDLKFPDYYPTSVLLGCVNIVGSLKLEDHIKWKEISEGLRLEGGMTEYCWLCEEPQKLLVPLRMRGQQHIYNLDRRILEEAQRTLRPVFGPRPVKFPLETLPESWLKHDGSMPLGPTPLQQAAVPMGEFDFFHGRPRVRTKTSERISERISTLREEAARAQAQSSSPAAPVSSAGPSLINRNNRVQPRSLDRPADSPGGDQMRNRDFSNYPRDGGQLANRNFSNYPSDGQMRNRELGGGDQMRNMDFSNYPRDGGQLANRNFSNYPSDGQMRNRELGGGDQMRNRDFSNYPRDDGQLANRNLSNYPSDGQMRNRESADFARDDQMRNRDSSNYPPRDGQMTNRNFSNYSSDGQMRSRDLSDYPGRPPPESGGGFQGPPGR